METDRPIKVLPGADKDVPDAFRLYVGDWLAYEWPFGVVRLWEIDADDQSAQLAGWTQLWVGSEDAESRVLARLPGRGKPQRRIDSREFSTLREQRLADAIAEQAVAPDADEALRQNVLQEAPAEVGASSLASLLRLASARSR